MCVCVCVCDERMCKCVCVCDERISVNMRCEITGCV